MGFFTGRVHHFLTFDKKSRNPFQGGMGFFTGPLVEGGCKMLLKSQSLSGWDGVFHRIRAKPEGSVSDWVAIPFRVGWGFSHLNSRRSHRKYHTGRNPFQGGMGFFTVRGPGKRLRGREGSQSLSGWDGVFHRAIVKVACVPQNRSQSLSGWDGVFHLVRPRGICRGYPVAIPFRVGWGFSRVRLQPFGQRS